MKPSIAHEYSSNEFGRLVSVVRDTGIIKKDSLHFNATHGMSKSKEYSTWFRMKKRCYDVTNPDYPDYGGRGITVCDQWINSFESFFEYMGTPPSNKHSIDRINNNGNYEPGNCRWATDKEQARNRRNNRIVEYNGLSKSLSEWCEIFKIPLGRTHSRLVNGLPLDKVFDSKSHKYLNQKSNNESANDSSSNKGQR